MSADTLDPLEEVVQQAGPEPAGPVMLVDLEKAVPSAEKDHPILRALNLRRPEWPQILRRPVVLWVPEYLLSFLGRGAPDFLDWRSDTVYFTDVDGFELRPLLAQAWTAGADESLPERDRLARVEDLRSRLSGRRDDAPVVLHAHAEWLHELGRHLFFLGRLSESEQAYREALAIEKRLERPAGIAENYGNLGTIHLERGELEQAEQLFHESLKIEERLGRSEGASSDYANLGLVFEARGDLDQAESMFRRALEIDKSLGRLDSVSGHYVNLGAVFYERGELDEAERMYLQALEIDERLGRLASKAVHYANLGVIHQRRGDLDAAERMYLQALEIDERLGRLNGLAVDYNNLAELSQARGDRHTARSYWTKARDIYASIGVPVAVQEMQQQLDAEPDQEERPQSVKGIYGDGPRREEPGWGQRS